MNLFETYRRQYVQELSSSVTEAANAGTALQGTATRFFQRDKSIPHGLDIDKTETTRKIMNKLFMRCIEQVRNEPKKYIKERSLIDQLFNRPPIEDLKADRPVLYKDKWFSFGRFFAIGLDWDFVMLECCLLAFAVQVSLYDASLDIKCLLGTLLAYIMTEGLQFIRDFKGRRNIARHTLVDDKFLF